VAEVLSGERAGGGERCTLVDGKLIWKVLNRGVCLGRWVGVAVLEARRQRVCLCDEEDTSAED
jgi:hypothetical protein